MNVAVAGELANIILRNVGKNGQECKARSLWEAAENKSVLTQGEETLTVQEGG